MPDQDTFAQVRALVGWDDDQQRLKRISMLSDDELVGAITAIDQPDILQADDLLKELLAEFERRQAPDHSR